MEETVYRQSPLERLDWLFDFSWIDSDDYIIEKVVTCDSDDITITDEITGRGVRVWVSGGVPGDCVVIDCVVNTNSGRELHDALRLWIAYP